MEQLSWGDTVQIKLEANITMRPGALAEVCGVRKVGDYKNEQDFGLVVGGNIYLVEFSDGISIEIPENMLEKFNKI